MKSLVKILLPLLVLGASGWGGVVLLHSGPQPERKPFRPVSPQVDVWEVRPGDYQIQVQSRGTVAPRTQSTLIPEVTGRIVWTAPEFRVGGFFEAEDVLLEVDPADYRQAVVVAQAELAQTRLGLQEEEAQGEQARRDWDRLQMPGRATDLVLRRPQLESRRAALAAAQARLERARTDLERTRIRAPYAGRVLDKMVDLGQYVSPGTVLAALYAVDYVEIRLPLTDKQAAFVDLPEAYRGESQGTQGPRVRLSPSGNETWSWEGRLVRTEGTIDVESRQTFVVAQVDDPYARQANGTPPLKVGQFVEAEITGRRLSGVFVIPRTAVHAGNQVFVITPDSRVQRRTLTEVWRDRDNLVADAGLVPGERISLTPLTYVADGAEVQVQGAAPVPGHNTDG